MGFRYVYHINFQYNKVKVIVTIFFYVSVIFALYLEDYFMN